MTAPTLKVSELNNAAELTGNELIMVVQGGVSVKVAASKFMPLTTVVNLTGSQINKGQVVYVTGSQGTRMTVALAIGTSDATSATILGVALTNIANGSEGFIATSGLEVTGISTANLKYGQTAVLTLNGEPQISALKLTADKCSNIVLDAVSTAATRSARCTVTGTGDLKFTVTNTSGGTTFYTQTVSVPEPQVTLVTTLGTVVMELNPTAAPITVKNFLSYVNQSPSFYNGTIFHRVLTGSVAQGGGYTSGFVAKTGLSSPITLEVGKGLSNLQGTIAMARTDVLNSAQSQFFFNARDNVSYDTLGGGYAVFGKVISGLNLIIQISNLTATSEKPNTEVVITSATQTQ